MKKFMTSFAAIAAGFTAQHADAVPIQQASKMIEPTTEATARGQVASSSINVTDKAGDAFAFTLKRSDDTGQLMAYHSSHSSHASHASHHSHYSSRY